MIKYNTRFAPSPNGYLHLGHAYSAFISSELAKKSDGKFFIRIEDIDLGRCKKKYEENIYKDLNWLEIKYEKNIIKQVKRSKSNLSMLGLKIRNKKIYLE